jgi:hypothetical protein
MNRASIILLASALSACGGSLYYTIQGSSLDSPDAVYGCVQDQLQTLKYRRTQYDTDSRWYIAEKVDSTDRVSSGLYRKTVDRLEARVRPDASGASTLEITVKTRQEFATAAGTTSEERPASARVKRDASAVAAACGK